MKRSGTQMVKNIGGDANWETNYRLGNNLRLFQK